MPSTTCTAFLLVALQDVAAFPPWCWVDEEKPKLGLCGDAQAQWGCDPSQKLGGERKERGERRKGPQIGR